MIPIVVSIATVPSRIGKLQPTLDSLLAGDLVPTRILLVHPEFCAWEQSGYVVPDFLVNGAYARVEHVIASRDWGSSTKILGSIPRIQEPSYLVIADDDVIYSPWFLKNLIAAQRKNHGSSFSYHTYREHGVPVATGCDGVSFYTPNLDGIEEFAAKNITDTKLMYHDDLWLGFFLYQKGVRLRRLRSPEPVYTQVLPNNILSAPKEPVSARHVITEQHLPRLIQQLGWVSRAQLSFWALHKRVANKLGFAI
ncbi:hypothetical protein GGQ97_000299 [Sphingomonas kaistensis]|uniref:Glycosyltransferase family 2 protein n=1 Tax=Sphingomonas kaistensis TaxID=298708 RepID=A0A7X6BFZ0_9SPHN|nr:hypothetical protein [Sphingomonas kaistensis]NJC04506.1 hypothetical protein [Sphingomonas kaistensis]